MGGAAGGGLFDEEARSLSLGAVLLDMAQYSVWGMAEEREGLGVRRKGAPWGPPDFALGAEVEGLGELGEVVVVGVDEVGDGAAEVGEESGRWRSREPRMRAGDDGQVGDGIVAAAADELFAEGGGPVGQAAELPGESEARYFRVVPRVGLGRR